MRGNGQNLKEKKFHLSIRKTLFTVSVAKHWNRLLREVVEPPSLQVLKT